MKFVTFKTASDQVRSGWLTQGGVVDMVHASNDRLPADILTLIEGYEQHRSLVAELAQTTPAHHSLAEVQLLPPLPNPRSFRDFIGFEEHMLNASAQFGHQLAPEWYDMPVFYFTNHQQLTGPGAAIARPAGETRLDYELELACVIGRRGTNIPAEEADAYVFGYTVFNDWTARAIQGPEMRCHLGPAKGKDFASSIGPCLVTADELASYADGHGRYNLRMTSHINGQMICDNNYNTVYHTFRQMIARASANGVQLFPGDILGSGTVGGGCLMETGFQSHRALEPGDVVRLEIEGIGQLENTII